MGWPCLWALQQRWRAGATCGGVRRMLQTSTQTLRAPDRSARCGGFAVKQTLHCCLECALLHMFLGGLLGGGPPLDQTLLWWQACSFPGE